MQKGRQPANLGYRREGFEMIDLVIEDPASVKQKLKVAGEYPQGVDIVAA